MRTLEGYKVEMKSVDEVTTVDTNEAWLKNNSSPSTWVDGCDTTCQPTDTRAQALKKTTKRMRKKRMAVMMTMAPSRAAPAVAFACVFVCT